MLESWVNMDYFVENGMNEEVVKSIYDNYSNQDLVIIEHNRKNIVDIYNYFKKIGIIENNIKQLLLTDIDMFYIDFDEIKENIERYEISNIIDILNNNIELLNQIV